jgi:hypothetical protein
MAVNATAFWRVRPSGNNANGGGYDSAISGAGTDFSKQNSAQVAFNGTTVRATTAGTSNVITLVGYSATAADIGNCLNITGGTNFITGFYFITAQGGTTWTLDRNCTSGAGAAMTGNMGGGWADPFTNMTSSGPVVAGNTINVLGSGIPNPSSYVFDYTVSSVGTLVGGSTSNGMITWQNDPDTPSYKAYPDTTGGMPTVKISATTFNSISQVNIFGFWWIANTNSLILINGLQNSCFIGNVFDVFGFTSCVFSQGGNPSQSFIGCEFFSSTGTGGVSIVIGMGSNCLVMGCNFHDLPATSNCMIQCDGGAIINNIFAKNGASASAIRVTSQGCTVANNTIDGNGSHGIGINSSGIVGSQVFNNIITSHTAGGASGINLESGTLSVNNMLKKFIDFNSFFNNTANYNAISAGSHDTALGVTPYVGSSTQNYTLA